MSPQWGDALTTGHGNVAGKDMMVLCSEPYSGCRRWDSIALGRYRLDTSKANEDNDSAYCFGLTSGQYSAA